MKSETGTGCMGAQGCTRSWYQVQLQNYALKPCGFKLLHPCMRRRTSVLEAQGNRNGHPKTQDIGIHLGAKVGSKCASSGLVSLNACVRAAVCMCTVSGYSAHTSGAQVEERGGRRTLRNGGRQKSQGVSGRLGAKFGSKTMRSSPVASSSCVRAHADVCSSSKHRETGMGI